MTLHAKRMLEGDAVEMTEVSGLCSIRHYLETEHTVPDIYSLEGPRPSACQLGLAFALQVGE